MIPGFSGHLISEQFLEARLASCEREREATDFWRQLPGWRQAQVHLGPASSRRTLLEVGATPLLRALGFESPTDCGMGHAHIAASVRSSGGTAALMVADWNQSLDALWRPGTLEAATRGADWCLLFNGTHLRIHDTSRLTSRRYADFDLDAAADDPRTAYALWSVARAAVLDGSVADANALSHVIAASDSVGRQVCRSLRFGVLEASARVVEAFAARAPRIEITAVFPQALTLVYRLLFLFFAEARGLVPVWHPIYRQGYSLERLCDLAMTPASRGLWDMVQAVSRLAHGGCRVGDLRVTPYNGRLFAPARTPLAELRGLTEDAARHTVIALSTRPAGDGEGRERIAYRDLGVAQLGAVYETLLDYRPDVEPAPGDRRPPRSARVVLRPGSHIRKSTGTFYTPEPIVRYLVRRTLGPLVRDRAPEDILTLRVLDPSMGSGAFLVGACHYLAGAYADALVRSGGCHAGDLGTGERALIRRTIAERCLYGVDLNPMAVQLAQLSLWLATLAADRPLSFLDHHLVAGNSLFGTWLSMLRNRPGRTSSRRDLPLFDDEPMRPMLAAMLPIRFSLSASVTETLSEVRDKERALAALNARATDLSKWKRVADLWVARWLTDDGGIYEQTFAALSDEILHGRRALARRVAASLLEGADRAAAAVRPFHWELEFPEVFFDLSGQRRPDAGFDAVLGNPPWDMLRDDTHAADAPSRGAAARLVRFARDSGVYHSQGQGHANCYQLFLERSLSLLRGGGRIGMVLPWGLAADHGSAALRRRLLAECDVESLISFENRHAIFPIHRGVRFLLLTGENGPARRTIGCRFGLSNPDLLEEACDDRGAEPPGWAPIRLSGATISRLSPCDLAIPDLRQPLDLVIAERLASRYPPLGSADGWNVTFGRELNATEDRDAFSTARRGMPVLEGKHLEPFRIKLDAVQWSVAAAQAERRLGRRHLRARLAYRDVSSASNRTTLISAILPARTVSTHTIHCLKTTLPHRAQWYLCGLFNSLVLNYLVRLRVTNHVTTAIVEQLPVPTRDAAAGAFNAISARARRLGKGECLEVWAELQARVAHLYGLSDDEFDHILGTFPLLPPGAGALARHAFCA